MRIPILFSVVSFFAGSIQAEPCLDYACDSSIVREILDSNDLDTVNVHSVTRNNNSRIDSLILTGRGIKVVPGSIGKLSGLKYLSLGCVRFSGIPHDPLCNLLDSLPGEIGNLTELEYLNLDGNRLVGLPSSIGGLKNLVTLILEHNALTSLPATIGNLTKLEVLELGYNPLTTLPNEIGALGKLRYISLYAIPLQTLPSAIGNWSALEFAVIANTNLTTLPDEFCKLTALTQAELYRNKLVSLPDSIVTLKNLKSVFVEYNRLCFLSTAVTTWLDKNDSGWDSSQDCSTATATRRPKSQSPSTIASRVKSLPGRIEISYHLKRGSRVKIGLFNGQGKLLHVAGDGYNEAGVHSLKLRTSDAQKGIVFVRITGDFFTAASNRLFLY